MFYSMPKLVYTTNDKGKRSMEQQQLTNLTLYS